MGATTHVRPQQVIKYGRPGVSIDIRGFSSKMTKEELHEAICSSVYHTQRPIIVSDLPNWIIMSHKQFVMLLPYTAEMYMTDDRMYTTPMNVMEVEVDENLDTVRPEDVVITEDPDILEFESELDDEETQVLTKDDINIEVEHKGDEDVRQGNILEA